MTRPAAEAVAEEHRGLVWRVAYRFLHDAEDARDVTQDVLLRIHQGAGGPPSGANVVAWLYRVTANAALNYRRARARLKRRQDEYAAESARVVQARETAGLAADIASAINALPGHQRVIVTLRLMEDLPFAEIARIFDVTDGTVRVQFARGMRRLRASLAGWR